MFQHPISRRQTLRLSAAAGLVSLISPRAVRAADRGKTLIVGVISNDPKKALPKADAMAVYLADHLKDEGYEAGEGVLARDVSEMLGMLQRGEVDLVSETAFAAVHLSKDGAAEIMLREWKKGVSEYHTVFMTRKDTGIRSLVQLAGHTIAFEEPASTTGFLLPLAILRQQGMTAREVPLGAVSEAGTVGYSFTGAEINTAAIVAQRKADAGAISDLDWKDFLETPEGQKGDVVVFHETGPILRSTILARASLAANVKNTLRNTLLTMHEDGVGKDVMKEYNKISQYDAIADSAAISLAMVRELYPSVAAEIR